MLVHIDALRHRGALRACRFALGGAILFRLALTFKFCLVLDSLLVLSRALDTLGGSEGLGALLRERVASTTPI